MIELLPKGLHDAKMLLLAGSSAGGAGVLVNLDRIADLLANMGSKVEVRGLADSGWFLDNEPFDFATQSMESGIHGSATAGNSRKTNICMDATNCAPLEAIKQGIKYED